MAKLKLALCMEDREYQNRFTNCILNHYQNQFELHVFTDIEEYMENREQVFHGMILSGYSDYLQKLDKSMAESFVYLYDPEEEPAQELEMVFFVEKYQEVNRIMEAVLKGIGDEIQQVRTEGIIRANTRYIGVYSLCRKEFQLPVAVTLASILSEREKVLFIDLQGNSGLSQLIGKPPEQGLEELLVMAESGKYSRNRIMTCIGKLDHIDYVYPSKNTERLSETVAGTYLKLLDMISQELDYSAVVLNFGIRFVGFFELMNRCKQVYFLSKEDGVGRWREYEFFEEMKQRGYDILAQRVHRAAMPLQQISVESCERTVEQWKWNEVGEYVRKLIVQEETIACNL